MTIKIKPLNDRVVVRQLEAETVSAGGIALPGSKQEKPNEGIVVAVGKGTILPTGELVPMDIVEGDQVLFGEFAGTPATIDDEEFMILTGDEIIAILV